MPINFVLLAAAAWGSYAFIEQPSLALRDRHYKSDVVAAIPPALPWQGNRGVSFGGVCSKESQGHAGRRAGESAVLKSVRRCKIDVKPSVFQVKPQTHQTPRQSTTIACPMSYPQTAKLEVGRNRGSQSDDAVLPKNPGALFRGPKQLNTSILGTTPVASIFYRHKHPVNH
jgi:hypothetical protein